MQSTELKQHLQKLEKKLLVIYSILLCVLIGLALVSNFLMKYQAARQATSMIKRTSARDFRETVMTLNDAELDYFSGVVYFNQNGQRVFSLPANLDLGRITRPTLLDRLLLTRIEFNLYFDQQEQNKIGSVLFIFDRFSQVYWAIVIWIFFLCATFPLVRYSRIWITENYKKDVKLREETARAELAQHVRHDIRSPLGALKVATRDLASITDRQKKIIQMATIRIQEIVAELELIRSSDAHQPQQGLANVSLLSIAQEIIQEKRFRGGGPVTIIPHFAKNAFFLFSEIDAANIKRALSNIIENAIEASPSGKAIEVSLSSMDNENILSVKDHGVGIPAEALPRMAELGYTSKKHGTGRGLYYAKRDVEAMGGRFEISSSVGVGTEVRLCLPISSAPSWYRKRLEIPKNVVILDDQESSRLSLRERIEELNHNGAGVSINVFATADELRLWLSSHTNKNTIYLLDYDLGTGLQNGLQVADELGIIENSVLITGNFDSIELQRECIRLNIGLIPKFFLSEIEILPV